MITFLTGLLTGTDNLLAGGALGLLPASRRRRLLAAAAFGAAEVTMTLVGLKLGLLVGPLPGPIAVMLAGVLVLAASGSTRAIARRARHAGALVVLPLALSLDNLAAGAGLGAGGLGEAAVIGVTSACLAAVGIFSAAPIGARLPRLAAPLAGAAMLTVGLGALAPLVL